MARRGSWNPGLSEELKIGRSTVRIKRSLGEGGFAFIHLVEDVHTGRVLVLKRSSLQSHEGRLVYERESSIMRTLAHPNVVQFVTAVELPNYRSGAILMEYCPRGHLMETLNKLGGQRLPEEVVLSIMSDVVSAVKYLHDKGVTHRDIKLDNILRSSSGSYKLCDFGSCIQGRVPLDTAERRANEQEVVEKTTTQMYRAPEMVDLYMERELTEKVDVWALGCVLYAVCYLKNPFQDAGNLGILNARIRIPEDSKFSEGLVELIHRMLTTSPTYRPTASEVESGVHALSNGQPLPPSRASAAAETQRSRGSVDSAEIAPAMTGVVDARDIGGAEASGKRSSMSPGSKARSSTQGTPPGKASASAGATSKSREPQLNPNSVAARRLASRKSSSPSIKTEVEIIPQQQQQGVVGSVMLRNNEIYEGGQMRQGLGSRGSQGVGTSTSPDQVWHSSGGRPTQAATVAVTVVSPKSDAAAVGTNNFASFDQFSTSELALGHTDDFPEASFGAPATTEAFGLRPAKQGSAVSPGHGEIVSEGGPGTSVGLGDQRPSSPLVDLESPGLVDRGDHDVIALAQQLAEAFPPTSLGGTGWNGSGPLQQQAWLTDGHVGEGMGASAGQVFPFVPPHQGVTSRPLVVSQADSGFGSSVPCSSGGVVFGMPDMRRSASLPSSRRSSGSHPGITVASSAEKGNTSYTGWPEGFVTTFPASQSMGGGSQSNAAFDGGVQSLYKNDASMSTRRSPQEQQRLGGGSSDTQQSLTGSMACSKGVFNSVVPVAAGAPDRTRFQSTANGQQQQQQYQQQKSNKKNVFGGSSQKMGFPYPAGGGMR